MDLTLSPRHQALADEVAQFLARHGARAPKPHAGYQPPDERMLDWQALLVEHGYSSRTVPREYGGFGAAPDVLEGAIIAEGFARAGVWQGFMNQGVRMVAPTLLEVGTEAQKRDYVRPTILGRMLWCQGYSEPGAGSDLASVQTRAVRDGDDYVINGQKIWTSFAHYAHMIYVLCRTEPDRPKHQGLSYLLLSMRTPGIEVRPLPNMTGRREFNEVFFTDVRVPASQMVMGPGDGWKVTQVNLKHERQKLGDPDKITQRLHRLIALMRTPQADGRTPMQQPELRSRLLQLQAEAQALRAHHLRLLTEQARGVDSGVRRLIVKLAGTGLLWRLSALAIDAFGEAGLRYAPHADASDDDDVTVWNFDHMYDLGMLIGGGTSHIQKNIIAERGLGLPPEPRAAAPAATPAAGDDHRIRP
ncbi:MAG: acyl-CoA dehydrogenase family protein [Pseudomonadota bacterium]